MQHLSARRAFKSLASDESAQGNEAGGLVVVLVIWLLFWLVTKQGPISWFFLGTAATALVLKVVPEQEASSGKTLTVLQRFSNGVLSAAIQFFQNLSIGFGIVLALQIAFYFFPGASANTYGNIEQTVWDWLVRLKAFLATYFTIVTVAILVLISIAVGAWWPVLVASKARKYVSRLTTVTAAVLMFSFVTGAPAETKYIKATEGVRDHFEGSVRALPAKRMEATAYRWVSVAYEARLQQPDFKDSLRDYLARGVTGCALYNQYMFERTAEALNAFVTCQTATNSTLRCQG